MGSQIDKGRNLEVLRVIVSLEDKVGAVVIGLGRRLVFEFKYISVELGNNIGQVRVGVQRRIINIFHSKRTAVVRQVQS